MTDIDGLVSSFLSATHTTDKQIAARLLDVAEYDLNTAVALYFEIGPSNVLEETQPQQPLEYFEEKLLDCPTNDEPTQARQRRRNDLSSTNANAATSPGFCGVFAPPSDLVCAESFSELRRRANEERRWILVNIQTIDDFLSHRLNRDIWSNNIVQEILNTSYLFWQRNCASIEGKDFCHLYKVNTLPYVAVIDPRTGRQVHMWQRDKFKDVSNAVSELAAFTESQPLLPYSQPTASVNSVANTEEVPSPKISSGKSEGLYVDINTALGQLHKEKRNRLEKKSKNNK